MEETKRKMKETFPRQIKTGTVKDKLRNTTKKPNHPPPLPKKK